METTPLPEAIALFLNNLRQAERSPHTLRAYATELRHLSACHDGSVSAVSVDTLRAVLGRREG